MATLLYSSMDIPYWDDPITIRWTEWTCVAALSVFLFLREVNLLFMYMVSLSNGHREKTNFFLKRQAQELFQHTHTHTHTSSTKM